MYDTYGLSGTDAGVLVAAGMFAIIGAVIGLIVLVIALVGMWKVFEKAGKPGWAAIVPIYNAYILMEIIGKPWWWMLGLFASALLSWIPVISYIATIASFVVWVLVAIELAKVFNKDTGFAIGIALLPMVFLLILGFGDAKYVGVAATGTPVYTSPVIPTTPAASQTASAPVQPPVASAPVEPAAPEVNTPGNSDPSTPDSKA